MFLSLSFHNYKSVFKVRISSPLQTLLVNGSNRKETHPRRVRIKNENFPGETFPCKMSLCLYLYIYKVNKDVSSSTSYKEKLLGSGF